MEFRTARYSSMSHQSIRVVIDSGSWTLPPTKRFSYTRDPTVSSIIPLKALVRYVEPFNIDDRITLLITFYCIFLRKQNSNCWVPEVWLCLEAYYFYSSNTKKGFKCINVCMCGEGWSHRQVEFPMCYIRYIAGGRMAIYCIGYIVNTNFKPCVKVWFLNTFTTIILSES